MLTDPYVKRYPTTLTYMQGLGRGFVAKEAPRVIAGTIPSLLQRLTYHRVMGTWESFQ